MLPVAASAAERPDWAFGPTTPAPNVPPPSDPNKVVSVPGSAKTYTLKQLEDAANPPDWFPDEHPTMPNVVAHGRLPAVRACITCHVGSGHGHPENSRLPGATATYLLRQLNDFRSGARKGHAENMITIAKGMSDEEIKTAAEYFSGLKVLRWSKVTEADAVPKTYFGRGNMRLPAADGATEPLGKRIIELPEDPSRVALRDPHAGFVSYVPKGSLAKGADLVMNGGGGKTVACTVCHGPTLRGIGDVPGIAGRSPLNIARQLYYFQTGERTGPWPLLMTAAVDKLSGDDVLAISAYVGSLEP
jgi:cytochrome c553